MQELYKDNKKFFYLVPCECRSNKNIKRKITEKHNGEENTISDLLQDRKIKQIPLRGFILIQRRQ